MGYSLHRDVLVSTESTALAPLRRGRKSKTRTTTEVAPVHGRRSGEVPPDLVPPLCAKAPRGPETCPERQVITDASMDRSQTPTSIHTRNRLCQGGTRSILAGHSKSPHSGTDRRHRTGVGTQTRGYRREVTHSRHSYTTIVLYDGDGAGPACAVVGKVRKPILDARACN